MKKLTWIMAAGVVVLVVLILGAGSFGIGAPPAVYDPSYHPARAWPALQMTFRATNTTGTQLYRYVTDGKGNWRLDTLEGHGAGDVEILYQQRHYRYNAEWSILMHEVKEGQFSASYLLSPGRMFTVARRARSLGPQMVSGHAAAVFRQEDGEQFAFHWVTGVPLRWEKGDRVLFEAVQLRLGVTMGSDTFQPPAAQKTVEGLVPLPQKAPGK